MFHALFVNLSGLITIVINKNLIIKNRSIKNIDKTTYHTPTHHNNKT